jgi:hypothetical protein
MYEPLTHLTGYKGWWIGQLQGLYLHRIAQHRRMRSYIHVLIGIRTYESNVRALNSVDHAYTVDQHEP